MYICIWLQVPLVIRIEVIKKKPLLEEGVSGKKQLLCDAIRNLFQLRLSYFAKNMQSPIHTHTHTYSYSFMSAHFSHDCAGGVTCQNPTPVRQAANVRAYMYNVCITYIKKIKEIHKKKINKKYWQQMPKTPKGEL